MSDRTITERLQPSLLDRLTDSDPGVPAERRDDRVIDLRRLREIIQRDLSWLLNTANLGHEFDEEKYPNVARSVLNYGLSEVSGEYSTTDRAEMIRRSIARAISIHEPRIVPGSIDVTINPDEKTSNMTVALVIRADMWAQPLPMELYLRSEVDVTTGEVKMERRS